MQEEPKQTRMPKGLPRPPSKVRCESSRQIGSNSIEACEAHTSHRGKGRGSNFPVDTARSMEPPATTQSLPTRMPTVTRNSTSVSTRPGIRPRGSVVPPRIPGPAERVLHKPRSTVVNKSASTAARAERVTANSRIPVHLVSRSSAPVMVAQSFSMQPPRLRPSRMAPPPHVSSDEIVMLNPGTVAAPHIAAAPGKTMYSRPQMVFVAARIPGRDTIIPRGPSYVAGPNVKNSHVRPSDVGPPRRVVAPTTHHRPRGMVGYRGVGPVPTTTHVGSKQPLAAPRREVVAVSNLRTRGVPVVHQPNLNDANGQFGANIVVAAQYRPVIMPPPIPGIHDGTIYPRLRGNPPRGNPPRGNPPRGYPPRGNPPRANPPISRQDIGPANRSARQPMVPIKAPRDIELRQQQQRLDREPIQHQKLTRTTSGSFLWFCFYSCIPNCNEHFACLTRVQNKIYIYKWKWKEKNLARCVKY